MGRHFGNDCKKCGISVAAEDSEIHIEGLEDYTIEVDSSSEEDSLFTDSDPFADLDSDDDEGPPDQEPVSYSKL